MSNTNVQNNNSSMKTVVETFIIEETSQLIYDNEHLQKWNEKVEELQLEGQKTIVVAGKSPIPFLWMNTALVKTFETLCPTKEPITSYNKTPIPVEILELVSLSKSESYFDKIEIWFNEKQSDPVCIGYKYKEGETGGWSADFYAAKYLIGRWADVKSSLDQLIQRAKTLFIQSKKIELQLNIKRQQRELDDLEQNAEAEFSNGMPSTDLPF